MAKARAAMAKLWLRFKTTAAPAKDLMLKAREDNAALPYLTELGVTIDREESFYLEPNREGQSVARIVA